MQLTQTLLDLLLENTTWISTLNIHSIYSIEKPVSTCLRLSSGLQSVFKNTLKNKHTYVYISPKKIG